MERDVRRMTVYQTIIDNSIGRLSKLFYEWLIENHKAIGEPIMAYELIEFFEYVENSVREDGEENVDD